MDIIKLSKDEAKDVVKEVAAGKTILIDCRTKEEWNCAHAKGAVHFELARLESGELPDLPKDAAICTYCAAGGRAEMAKNILLKNGFANIKNLGGLKDWKDAGGEIEIKQD